MTKKSKSPKEKNVSALIDDAEKIRGDLLKKAFRRKDGVLQCPTAYANGYGIQCSKDNL